MFNWSYLFIHWMLGPYIKPGQNTHVFIWIVIFKLSNKECNESIIVKHSINQNNFCKGDPKFLFCPEPHWDSVNLWLGFSTVIRVQFLLHELIWIKVTWSNVRRVQGMNYGVKTTLEKKVDMQIDPTGRLDNILSCFTDFIT